MPKRRPHSLLSFFAFSALSLASLTTTRSAQACGAAYPGGPVVCIFPDKRPTEAPLNLRLSASYAYTDTTLLFGDDRRADLTRHAVFGGVQLAISDSADSSRYPGFERASIILKFLYGTFVVALLSGAVLLLSAVGGP